MLFYPSKNNNRLNRQEFTPELISNRVMLNPYYRVRLTNSPNALCDSGAFQDIDKFTRLAPSQALERQLNYEIYLQKMLNNPLWFFEGIVTYDQMLGVDEQIVNGKKVKKRGNEETARDAIKETLLSAEYYHTQRHKIQGKIIFAAQGASPVQYINECVLPLLEIMKSTDWLALGGFCIIGKVPSLKPSFVETFRNVLPLLKKKQIKRVHILGVCVADMIKFAHSEGKIYGIEVSTDSSSIEVNSIMGRVFNDGKWAKVFAKEQKYVDYHPCELALQNIRRFEEWLALL